MPRPQFVLLLILVIMYIVRLTNTSAAAALAPAPVPPSNCSDKCGNVSIPYPFGISKGCFLDLPGAGNFEIHCDNWSGDQAPFIGNVMVTNISLEAAEMVVNTTWSVTFVCRNISLAIYLRVFAPYLLSPTGNMFTAVGCDATARLHGKTTKGVKYKSGCITYCASASDAADDGAPCKGLGCCEVSITPGLANFSVEWGKHQKTSKVWEYNPCQFAFLAKNDWYRFKKRHLTAGGLDKIHEYGTPVVLDWAIRSGSCPPKTKNINGPLGACLSNYSKCANATSGQNGYFCICSHGYNGNPYIPNGCIDINECSENQTICDHATTTCRNIDGSYECKCKFGLRHVSTSDKKGKCEPIFPTPAIAVLATFVLVSVLVLLLIFVIMEHQKRKLRDYFNRNGGQLLKSIKIDIFTREKLNQITKNYSNIIGKGGFGMVYMGTINGNVQVAVKRSITVNNARQKDFANEITIQSQISHKNLVKLLGCCLETDVPMLVYEFVPRGSLYDVLHGKNKDKRHPLLLTARLDIAVNSADALAYMHSYARQKILHGDVKSGNILLDENFTPKVSDFGTSRLMTIGKDHTTFVVGDMSYMDPVYMKTGLLTEKSDVYSFGIVLLELITGRKPRYDGNNSLPIDFMEAYMTDSKGYEMYDMEIISHEEDKKCVENVGRIAVHCLKDNVNHRPAMTEVVKDLQTVRSAWLQNHQQMEH